MKIKQLLVVATLALSSVAMPLTAQASTEQAQAFAALDHKQAVLQSHQWYRNDKDIVVRILPDRVVATFADGSESSVAIPEDEYFLSIAPYINYTHKCTYHVPTGCTAELVNKPMHVVAVDVKSGEEVINRKLKTQHDGFIDFWVPNNRQLKFTISAGDYQASEVLTTGGDSRTCITTMQLTR